MAKIKLPDIRKCPIVCFHYNPNLNPSRVVLQVPIDNFSDSSTFNLDLDRADDTKFFSRLKNGEYLLDQIRMYGHVIYTNKGEVAKMEDDNEKRTPRFHNIDARFAREPAQVRKWAHSRYRQIPTMRRKKSQQSHLSASGLGDPRSF